MQPPKKDWSPAPTGNLLDSWTFRHYNWVLRVTKLSKCSCSLCYYKSRLLPLCFTAYIATHRNRIPHKSRRKKTLKKRQTPLHFRVLIFICILSAKFINLLRDCLSPPPYQDGICKKSKYSCFGKLLFCQINTMLNSFRPVNTIILASTTV